MGQRIATVREDIIFWPFDEALDGQAQSLTGCGGVPLLRRTFTIGALLDAMPDAINIWNISVAPPLTIAAEVKRGCGKTAFEVPIRQA